MPRCAPIFCNNCPSTAARMIVKTHSSLAHPERPESFETLQVTLYPCPRLGGQCDTPRGEVHSRRRRPSQRERAIKTTHLRRPWLASPECLLAHPLSHDNGQHARSRLTSRHLLLTPTANATCTRGLTGCVYGRTLSVRLLFQKCATPVDIYRLRGHM